MAIIINSVGDEKFTLNGKSFARIFQPLAAGLTDVAIYNTYDTRLQIVSPTHYSEFVVNGTTYTSQDTLIQSLLNVVFIPQSGGGGGTQGPVYWGDILGTLTNQGDLSSALNGKSNVGHTHTFASITDKPSTIAGYGITDFNTLGDDRWALKTHTHSFSSLTGKPTTLAGYGITDAYTQQESDALYFKLIQNTLTSSANLNLEDGVHRTNTGATSIPASASKSMLLNYTWDANARKQVFYPYNSYNTYERYKAGASWSDWALMWNNKNSFDIIGSNIYDFGASSKLRTANISLGEDTSRHRITGHDTGTNIRMFNKANNYAGLGVRGLCVGDAFAPQDPPFKGLAVERKIGLGLISPVTDFHMYDTSANTNAGGDIGSIIRLTNTSATVGSGGEVQFGNSTTGSNKALSLIKGVYSANNTTSKAGQLELWTQPAGGSITQRMIVDSEGNVGINTSSPSEKLDVDGNIRAGERLMARYSIIRDNNTGSTIISQNSANTVKNIFIRPNGDANSSGQLLLSHLGNMTYDGDITANAFFESSDKNLKEEIKPIEGTIFREFKFKGDDTLRYGVIAQEVQETNPELVKEDNEGMLSVNYIDLLCLKIAKLEQRIKELEDAK